MKNLMMVGRILNNGELEKFRMVDVLTKEVLDLDKGEIKKMLQEETAKIPNLELNSNGEIACPHDINKYGIVGKTNAFVVISKKIIDGAIVDGISFEISDVNGLVKTYFQSDAANLDDFYNFANVRVRIGDNLISTLPNSNIFIIEALSKEERMARATSFVKELQKSKIEVVAQQMPYKHESSNKFALSVLGRIGRINTMPGQESFNKKIINALNFNNASLDGNCKFIQPTHGYTDSYIGWKSNSKQVTELPKAEFIIDDIDCYGDDFLNDENYNKSDYLYCVNLKFLNTYVYVLKNSKIGKVRVLKQS